MDPNDLASPPAPPVGHQAVLCAQCEHLNPLGRTECELCGAQLFISCPKCGVQNRRVLARCQQCHARLHPRFGHGHHRHHHRSHHHHHHAAGESRAAHWVGLPWVQALFVLLGLAIAAGLLFVLNHARWAPWR